MSKLKDEMRSKKIRQCKLELTYQYMNKPDLNGRDHNH